MRALAWRAAALLLAAALHAGAAPAQTDAQRAAMERTAERLAASPVLQPGEVQVDVAPAEGQFFWIEPPADGLYRLSLDGPGALRLSSFGNATGRFDGETPEHVVAEAADAYGTPGLGPFLMARDWPYLLSVNATGPAKLGLEQIETFAAPAPLPERDETLAPGDYLLELAGELRLRLDDPDTPLRIATFAEPRADHEADLDGVGIRRGLEPFDPGAASGLRLRTQAPEGQPVALTLLRIAPVADAPDETEPNRDDPDPLDLAAGFRGLLLAGADRDRMSFTLAEARDVALAVETDAIWTDFALTLERLDARQRTPVLSRRAARGQLPPVPMRLPPGDYELVLAGENPNDRHVAYTVRLDPAAPPAEGREAEPNDAPAAATPVTGTGTLRGSVAADDVDFASFSVEAPDRLWRVFALNAERLILYGPSGTVADVGAVDGRAIADALALAPGDYTVEIRGIGDYALRVMDLGGRPDAYEAEPNDDLAAAQLLGFGRPFTGAFPSPGDVDIYQFRLGAETAVEIAIEPADDGPMDAKLFLGSAQWGNPRDFAPGDGTYRYRGDLPAGDWFIQLRPRSTLTRGSYRVSVERRPALADRGPDYTPMTARPVPMDGDVAGSVGAFDAEDHLLVRLPAAPRAALIACHGDGDGPGWSLWPWSGGRKIENPRAGLIITDPTAEPGGAVRIVVSGDAAPRDYRCAVRFAPDSDALPAARAVPEGGEIVLAPGDHLRGALSEASPRQLLSLGVGPDAHGALACFDGEDQPLEPGSWRPRGLDLVPSEAFAPFVPFRAGADAAIEMRAPRDAAFPATWRCALMTLDQMPRLADLGPLAELVAPPDAAPATPGTAPSAAGAPPSLDALLSLVPPDTQPSGDLPIAFAFDSVPPLAAYDRHGQRLALGATLANTGDLPLDLALSAAVAGDGWDIALDPATLALEPGATARAELTLTAPPWLSPVVPPAVTLIATSGARFAAAVPGVEVAADTAASAPFVYHDAPDALRGGLNLLHWGLGSRLVEMDGTPVDDREAAQRAYLHDGIAPHAHVREVGRELTFRLPAPARVAGMMFQFRSTANPLRFPGEYEVYLSADGSSWTRAAAGPFGAVLSPQYAVFDAPATAAFVRVVFPDCPPNGCDRVAVQEIQAIGVPGEHPEGWAPVNAADPALGGHVLYAEPTHSGAWNATLLAADPGTSNSGWRLGRERMHAVIGFHQNRAALVERLVWVGNPKDKARAEGTRVDASLAGPAGPWTRLGVLPAPPAGEERAELVLDRPTWARYVRLTFALPSEVGPSGPDAVEIIEAPGTSVIGLWEDDRPEAAYEASRGEAALAAVPPAGGPDAEHAVPLSAGESVTSSVLLERNEDWWTVTVPEGPAQEVQFEFRAVPLEVAVELTDAGGESIPLERGETDTGTRMTAVLSPGDYRLRVHEPPRSVVIAWDTSGSVASYIPRTLAAVRLWSESLVPGRDALQLLPFSNQPEFALDDWAGSPEDVAPALRNLPTSGSSDAETTLAFAADALARREGARGIVIITDAETGPYAGLWPNLLRSRPRVVALSIDSDGRQTSTIMMDWANLNRGRFQRVVGAAGLADGLDMAAALFRAPKPYHLTLTRAPYEEPEGEATIALVPVEPPDGAPPAPSGAVEVILDASGSMLQRLDGKRRIAIAHDALSRLVQETLPDGMPFAFRAFGLEADACRSELRMPLGPLDRTAARKAIRDVPAINNARTAIADSLTAAARDLAEAGEPRVVVLVTDGEETCDGDPEAAIEAMRESGLDVRVNIVGFAIDDAGLAATFAAWAEAGGGAYFEARDSRALDAAVDRALTARFAVARRHLDGRSEPLGTLAPGDTMTVPAGQIEITPESIAAGEGLAVRLLPGDALRLDYDPVTGLSGN